MTEYDENDSPLTDDINEAETSREFQEFGVRTKFAKSSAGVMRQIEIMRENKLLKSSIEDIYDYF